MSYFDNMDQAMIDAMDQQYEEAEVKRKYVELPNGDYQMYIDEFRLIESKKNIGEVGLFIRLVVFGGEYEGISCVKYIPITLDSMDRLKSDLVTLGFNYDGIRSLDDPQRLADMLDLILDVRILHKKSAKSDKIYTNVYINRVCGKMENTSNDEPQPPWGRN